jgi:hypothetical protein
MYFDTKNYLKNNYNYIPKTLSVPRLQIQF